MAEKEESMGATAGGDMRKTLRSNVPGTSLNRTHQAHRDKFRKTHQE